MSGKRKRDEDEFEFTPPSAKLSKAQRDEVTRSGRSRKKPARFLDESIEEDIDKLETESVDNEEETPTSPIQAIKTTVKSPHLQQKLLLQTLQTEQKPVKILTQQKVQPIQIQIPGSSLLKTVSVPQGIRVVSPTSQQLQVVSPTSQQLQIVSPTSPQLQMVSPTSPQLQAVSPTAPQFKVLSQMVPQVKQQVVQQIVPQNVVTTPTTPPDSQAGTRGRVRKKSAKVLEMEEFEEAEKTKPKKMTGKQQSPITSPLPPTGVTIVRNEQGQNVVVSVAGGIPEPTKKSKTKEKLKFPLVNEMQVTENLIVKEEPSDLSSAATLSENVTGQSPSSTKKQKQIKSEPVTSKKQQMGVVSQEPATTPTKKGKSVIKMLLNTPTQFTAPTVSTTAISSDKPKELDKTIDVPVDVVKTEPTVVNVSTEKTVKKIILSPSDLDDGHLSFDEDEDDDEFDDELDDEDEGDDEDEMDWQFESQDGTLLAQEELARKVKEISPSDLKKSKKKASKKKTAHDDDEFDDDDFGDDDDDEVEGNLVIADEFNKKKKTTKKAPSKKKADTTKGGTGKAEKPTKEKKKKRLTAYTMWCNSMRNKVLHESPGIDFAQLSRRLGEIWQGLPSRDKMSWKRKAKREARKLLGKGLLIRTGKSVATTPSTSTVVQQKTSQGPKSVPPIHHTPITHHRAAVTVQKMEEHAVILRGSGIEPIDVAAYLKLVGESLSIIGMRLQEHRGLIAVQGSLSVLLDSLLCALGPLMCLTTQIPELHGCPAETHNRTLDNLAYFMPGL